MYLIVSLFWIKRISRNGIMIATDGYNNSFSFSVPQYYTDELNSPSRQEHVFCYVIIQICCIDRLLNLNATEWTRNLTKSLFYLVHFDQSKQKIAAQIGALLSDNVFLLELCFSEFKIYSESVLKYFYQSLFRSLVNLYRSSFFSLRFLIRCQNKITLE